MYYGADTQYYPEAARAATTTADILGVVGGASVPDTSTVSELANKVGPAPDVLTITFLVGLLLGAIRVRRRPALSGRSAH